jgi:hypothetical protein
VFVSANTDSVESQIYTAIGALIVIFLFITLALVASGGWNWFQKFLTDSAPAWLQAFGSIAAIIATFGVLRVQHQQQSQRDSEIDRQTRIRKLKAIVALIQGVGATCEDCAHKVRSGEGLMDVELRRLQSAQALVSSVPIMDVPDVLVVLVFSDVLERLHLAERMIEELEKFPTEHSKEARKEMSSVIDSVSTECFLGTYEIVGLISALSTVEERKNGKASSFPNRDSSREAASKLWETLNKKFNVHESASE